MAAPSHGSIYEAAWRECERLERERLLAYANHTNAYMNGSLNAAAAMQRQMLEQQQQKTRGSRETTRRNSLLLLTKKGR